MATKYRRREAETPPSRFARVPVVGQLQRATTDSESGLRRFFRDIRSELRKVVWPTREHAINLTMIVCAVSVAVGVFLGGLDLLFAELFKVLLGRV
ncbi:MAG TPA: preprotein translocase subunit SecE [Chloroflexota bacterium]|jgi:preprotein translocase subunit SecE|nr:preprotein translocase subunit SecE [Chloroflexota bacterium]